MKDCRFPDPVLEEETLPASTEDVRSLTEFISGAYVDVEEEEDDEVEAESKVRRLVATLVEVFRLPNIACRENNDDVFEFGLGSGVGRNDFRIFGPGSVWGWGFIGCSLFFVLLNSQFDS